MLNKRPFFPILFLCFFIIFSANSQNISDFGFLRDLSVPVTGLKHPWAGGMNACQFSNVDLNLDGRNDLFVFDRHGFRIMTFLNNGNTTSDPWVFTADYNAKFPPLYDWVRFADYNCDGKMDIFTYGVGGIKVYLNVSVPLTGLKFKLITNQLPSLQFNSLQGIYISSVDYPAIADLDLDGDLDILTFWIIGTYIHYHRNMSMEKYGNCDSLDFRLEHKCWGYMKENESTASLVLNMPCPFKCSSIFDKEEFSLMKERHTGSTLLAIDLNGNGLKDLIIGDVDYPNLTALYNTGSTDTARMTSQDTTFPNMVYPFIDLNAFPASDFIDINNDHLEDLLVSPFDPNVLTPENVNSSWLYTNDGTFGNPHFQYARKDFLQGEMIDLGTAAYPLFEDINGDGLLDLIVSSFGFYDSSWVYQNMLKSSFTSRLLYYQNTGTQSNPAFQLVDTNYAGVYALHIKGAVPAFGDPDNDLDRDLLLGNSDGKLIFLENTAGAGQFPVYAAPAYNYNGIDVGEFSAPQWVDLDNDNTPDLVIGDVKGALSWYRKSGNTWVLENDTLGGVDVRNPLLSYEGYSIPHFFRGYDDKLKLFVGSQQGGVAFYRNIEGHLQDTFTLVDPNYLAMRIGDRSAIALGYLNGDTLIDMVCGTVSGGLGFWKGIQPGPAGLGDQPDVGNVSLIVYPNPARDEIAVYLETPVTNQFQGMITDLSGRPVKEFDMHSNSRIMLNLNDLQNGIYLLVMQQKPVSGNSVRFVKRIILCR